MNAILPFTSIIRLNKEHRMRSCLFLFLVLFFHRLVLLESHYVPPPMQVISSLIPQSLSHFLSVPRTPSFSDLP